MRCVYIVFRNMDMSDFSDCHGEKACDHREICCVCEDELAARKHADSMNRELEIWKENLDCDSEWYTVEKWEVS